MATNGCDPISPVMVKIQDEYYPGEIAERDVHFTGLSKRELFAAMAMQGMLSYGSGGNYDFAKHCVIHADELIQALNKTDEPF